MDRPYPETEAIFVSLQSIAAALCIGLLTLQASSNVLQQGTFADHDSFGCEANPTGNPIGGGEGYSDILTRGDFTVRNKDEFFAALKEAQAGQVIFFPDGVEIDLTGHEWVKIPGGVTLAGTRGLNGSRGARIFTTQKKVVGLASDGHEIRLTGLRFEGPFGGIEKTPEMATFFHIKHFGVEIDNCEIYNWNREGVYGTLGASKLYVHHNHIHHCQYSGLGYGVVLYYADARIIGNFFEHCRHAIAGGGHPGTAYEAAWNLFSGETNGHTLDMHGGKDRGDDTNIAGDYVLIHHNTFMPGNYFPEIVIRGTPAQGCEIHHNWFERAPNRAMWLFGVNSRAYKNIYEKDKKTQDGTIEGPNRKINAEGKVVTIEPQ